MAFHVRRFLIVLALLWATPAAAATMIVQLRTDFLPQADFEFVQVDVFLDNILVADDEWYAVHDDYVRGVKVAEIELGAGDYRVVTSLIDDAGSLIASEPTRVAIGGEPAHPITVTIARPRLSFNKTDVLQEDRNGDGWISAGDTVRYVVEVEGPMPGGRFADTPAPGAVLMTGTVNSSSGSVQQGNDVGDKVVVVDLDSLDAGEMALVTFDVEMTPVASNQAHVRMTTVATPNSMRRGDFRSSDTDVGVAPAPTVTPVSTAAVSACRVDLNMAADELQAIAGDPDVDGVPAIGDACPDTPPGAIVDIRGCSRDQFCSGIDTSTGQGLGTCHNADWLDDEPGSTDPEDCTVLDGACRSI